MSPACPAAGATALLGSEQRQIVEVDGESDQPCASARGPRIIRRGRIFPPVVVFTAGFSATRACLLLGPAVHIVAVTFLHAHSRHAQICLCRPLPSPFVPLPQMVRLP